MNRRSFSVAVRLVGVSLCLLAVSCGGGRGDAQALYEANAAESRTEHSYTRTAKSTGID